MGRYCMNQPADEFGNGFGGADQARRPTALKLSFVSFDAGLLQAYVRCAPDTGVQ